MKMTDLKSSPLVEVFVLCYNRKDFVLEAIGSILKQTYQPIKVIVSDNSPTTVIADFLKPAFPDLEIRRRVPSVLSYDHFNIVLSEVSAPYFMIFHDDDVLGPNYISSLVEDLERTGAAAACTNAHLIFEREKSPQLLNSNLHKDLLLTDPAVLARRYLDYSAGVNPLPGYIYRSEAVRGLSCEVSEAGQYCDVTFLIKVAQRGPVFWKAEPLMSYRKHGNNMSGNVSLLAAKKMVRFLINHRLFTPNARELRQFRYWNHLFYIRNRKRQHKRVHWAQIKLVAFYFVRHPGSIVHKFLTKYLPN